jgi:hypothetical protein
MDPWNSRTSNALTNPTMPAPSGVRMMDAAPAIGMSGTMWADCHPSRGSRFTKASRTIQGTSRDQSFAKAWPCVARPHINNANHAADTSQKYGLTSRDPPPSAGRAPDTSADTDIPAPLSLGSDHESAGSAESIRNPSPNGGSFRASDEPARERRRPNCRRPSVVWGCG